MLLISRTSWSCSVLTCSSAHDTRPLPPPLSPFPTYMHRTYMTSPAASRRSPDGQARGGGAVPHDSSQRQGHGAGRQPHRPRLGELHHRR